MTQCAKIIVGFMANVDNVFIKRFFFNFFFNFFTFYVFYLFLRFFHLSVWYIDGLECGRANRPQPTLCPFARPSFCWRATLPAISDPYCQTPCLCGPVRTSLRLPSVRSTACAVRTTSAQSLQRREPCRLPTCLSVPKTCRKKTKSVNVCRGRSSRCVGYSPEGQRSGVRSDDMSAYGPTYYCNYHCRQNAPARCRTF